jgi:molecular chaperone Hsp33
MKSQSDSLRHFLFEHAPIRGVRVYQDASWQCVLKRHDYSPQLRQMIGELTAAAVLLASMLKLDGRVANAGNRGDQIAGSGM